MSAQEDIELSCYAGCLAKAKKALEYAQSARDPYLRNIWVEIAQAWQQLAEHHRRPKI